MGGRSIVLKNEEEGGLSFALQIPLLLHHTRVSMFNREHIRRIERPTIITDFIDIALSKVQYYLQYKEVDILYEKHV